MKDHEGLVGGISFTDNNRSLASVSSLSQVFASGEDVGTTGAPPSETGAPHPGAISDGNGDWHSSFGKKLKNYEGSPSELQFPHESRSSFLVNPSSQLLVEDLGSTDALHSEVAASDGNGDWVSSFGKSVGEVIFCISLSRYRCSIYMISMFYYPENSFGFRQTLWGLIWTHLMTFFLGLPQAMVSNCFTPFSISCI